MICHIHSRHLVVQKTFDRLARHFFWVGMKKSVVQYCRTCDACQRVGKSNLQNRALLINLPVIGTTFSKLAIDIVGPLKTSQSGRAWPIHRRHSPSGPIVGQSEPSANDDNRWPVRADISRWFYSLNSPSHGLYRPLVQNHSRFRAVYAFDDCSSIEGGIYLCVRPGQQPMQFCSNFEGGCVSLVKLFFYYLVVPPIIVPGLDWMW